MPDPASVSAEPLPSSPHETSERFDQALFAFLDAIGFSGYGHPEHPNTSAPKDPDDPHASLVTPAFRIRPFDWSDSEDPRAEVNLEYAGGGTAALPFRLSWYKYAGRSMTTDREVFDHEVAAIFDHCRQSLGPGHEPGFRVHGHRGMVVNLPRPFTARTGASVQPVEIAAANGERTSYLIFRDRPAWLAMGQAVAFDAQPARKPGLKPVIVSISPFTGRNAKA